ncbi:hypothetical protein HPB51_022385 [Rhipicephalus microplus]|uniref:Uncharacterized protein n=1 Tax=Rhipicephalus microplus TaxID=6941 RepID=A0A9J6DQY2_RHIMP|nr:hypothetical protein HPB51_022385 [Rhipicephalus microplus]
MKIRVNGKKHKVAVFTAIEGICVEVVICNVQRDIGDAKLTTLIVYQENLTVRGVKRIKDTGSVVVLFDGGDVPSYNTVGQAIYRCYHYKKQIEVCRKCTRVGHHVDICPTPLINVCTQLRGERPEALDTRAS